MAAIKEALLDTHALLWWLFDDPQLSKAARKVIANPDYRIWVSSASAWEISTKHRLGKLPQAGDVVKKFSDYIRKSGFEPLNLSTEHALLAGSLSGPHRDPFDRMLIAVCQIKKLPIITVDPVFKKYRVKVIW